MKKMPLIYLVLLAAVVFLGWLYVFQERLVYLPDPELAARPSDRGLDHEDVFLETGDGTSIHAWWVPARPERAAVVFCHGNAGNISHRLDTLAIMNGLGLSVMIFDYPGYGKSGGRVGEKGTALAARAAWEHVAGKLGRDPGRMICWGRSLGAAVAARLAAEAAEDGAGPGALVLESSFTSVPDMGARVYPFLPVRILARIRHDTRAWVSRTKCPVLVAHSPQDQIVPLELGRRVFGAAPGPREFLELSGGHNSGFLVSGETYVRGVDAFLRRAGF